jgi:hypothetical protein
MSLLKYVTVEAMPARSVNDSTMTIPKQQGICPARK